MIGTEVIICRIGILRLEIGEKSRPFFTGRGSLRLNQVEIMFGVLMGSWTCFCIQNL